MKRLASVICVTLLLFAMLNLFGMALFQGGLRRYYCLYPADFLVIGHSMSEMGIDRDLLEEGLGRSVAKYCMNGAGTADRFIMLKHYVQATGHKPQYVIYDVSARSFSLGLADNSYALFYPFLGSKIIGDYVRQNALIGDYWLKKLIPLSRYDDTRFGAVLRGYRHDWRCSSKRKVDLKLFAGRLERGDYWKISFDEENMRLFDETLAWLNSENIGCILVALPCLDLLNSAQPELYAEAMVFIQETAARYPNVVFYDMNVALSARHELFRDPIHLNRLGQIVCTEQLAKDIHEMLE